MIYTTDIPNQKYFLNDKNIASSLAYGDIQLNAIPSLDLVSSLYNSLSTEDKRINDYLVSVETSAYSISSNVDVRLLELSDTLSTYTNELCENVSTQVEINRNNDKAELSNTLSTYTDSSVLKLSTSLSNRVNEQFMHLSGDTVDFIYVKGKLSVAKEVLIDSNTRIAGSLIQGESVKATHKSGIALGISAEAVHTNSFVWNGNDNIENYQSHGERGTFNINPEAGVNGFYIGQQTLSTIISNDVQLTANNLTTQISVVSSLLSNQIEKNRIDDKAELSNTLSTYANSLCSAISVRVDENRTNDKAELSNTLSTYANELTTSLSNTVKNAGFAKSADTTFTYDETNHKISLVLTDYLGSTTTLTVDTTDFIKNRIVDHVHVVTPSQDPSLSESVLRIWWTPDSSSTAGIYTDIPISQLAKVYTGTDGITITEDLSIMVDNTVARTAALNDIAITLNKVSAETVPNLITNIDAIQEYVDKLSVDAIGNRGIIATLSNAITADVQNLDTLSADMKTLSGILTTDIDANKQNIAAIHEFDDMLSNSVGGVPVGAIPTLSHDLDILENRFINATIYAGKIEIEKYDPDWRYAGYDDNLSSILKYKNLAVNDRVKNGSMFEVVFTPKTYTYDDTVFAADQIFVTADGIKLSHKEWLYIIADPGNEEIELTAIKPENVRFLNAVKFNEHNALSATINQNYIWLSGNNNTSAVYELSVINANGTPQILSATGHSIGGNNYFADGGNYFDGANTIKELSSDKISVEWSNLVNPSNGYTLFDLSSAVSSKIFIDNRVEGEISSGTSDLSIVKISKDDYDELVANPTIQFDNSTLYIVDSPYVDCYGQQIKNLAKPDSSGDATNKQYVDETILDVSNALSIDYVDKIENLSTSLSTDIDTLSTALSTEIRTVGHVFSQLYTNISGITGDSQQITDIVSAIIAIKDAIAHLSSY